MKIQAKISPKIIIEVEGKSQTDVFDQLATASEVFGESCCGMCEGTDFRFAKRIVGTDEYYELVCTNGDCGAKLSFGLSKQKKGEMFPIRKIIQEGKERGRPNRKNGTYDKKHRGWTKYKGQPLTDEDFNGNED